MDFENWSTWSGTEVASFIGSFCGLPQYDITVSRNLTGPSLKHLASKGMLQKGLARAGVGNTEHQQRITAAVMQLHRLSPEELLIEHEVSLKRYNTKQWKPAPPAKPRPKGPQNFRRPQFAIASQISEALTPRMQTATEVGLQRTTKESVHGSMLRGTPMPFDKAIAASMQEGNRFHRLMPDAQEEIKPLLLRSRVAESIVDFEAMRQADSPQPEVGLRGIQELRREEEGAATKIQARFRGKQATKEMQRRKDEYREECNAATTIQSRFRSKKAVREVQEAREEKKAATTIQTRFRARQATYEAQVRRQEKKEMEEGAVKIQAVFRGKQARNNLTQGQGAADQQAEKDEEQIDIPMDDDTANAATKMQAKYRQKQAKGEVEAKRQERKEMEEGAVKIQAVFRGKQARARTACLPGEDAGAERAEEEAGGAAEDEGILMDEDTANAATKIQAKYRQKQAKSEVEAKRQERKEMEEGAVKIQAVFRGKQARKGHGAEVVSGMLGLNEPARTEDAEDEEIPMDEDTANAATKIQAKYRQKQAKSEVEAKRQERKEMEEGAVKIQAVFRGKQARARTAFLPGEDTPAGEEGAEEDAGETAEDEGIPMDEDTANAATKIQAKYRQKQAKSEVEAKRQERKEMEEGAVKIQAVFRGKQARARTAFLPGEDTPAGEEGAEEDAGETAEDEGIPMDEDTANAATKIQAKYRQKQAKSEVEAKRQEKKEMEEGAVKIQAVFRGKQARKGLAGEDGEVEP
eukprot:TRINITY_DN2526_c0_g1_i2.p1 TRINITY_DN2526_c0_g1~~TRINITY_DN2526_c0_g1_i2.p1  ORF type:complete len:778 (-),score=229.79 TRINITY_DN2526_c0_g1_i2:40-2289(-)